MPPPTFLPAVLRSTREAAGWTQVELAAFSDVDINVVTRAEQGRSVPSTGALIAIARTLGVPLEFFYDGDEVPA
jgi:transcriptional regulator with XRE-family HTH domain